jgi:hypothetical protein
MTENDVVKDIESEEDKASHDNIQRRSQEHSQTLVDNLSRLGSLGVSQFPQQALQARMQLILQARAHMRQYGHSTSSLANRLTSSLGLGIGYGSSLTANAFQASSSSIPIGGNSFLLGNINSSVSHFQNRLPSSSTNNLSAPLMNHGLPSMASFQSTHASSSITSFQSTHASMAGSRNIPASNSTSTSASSSRSMSISSLLQQPQTPSPNQHYNPFA